jgi:hypothetical protein
MPARTLRTLRTFKTGAVHPAVGLAIGSQTPADLSARAFFYFAQQM